jgi:hypothetical protein
MLISNLERKRLLGRKRCRWKENMNPISEE